MKPFTKIPFFWMIIIPLLLPGLIVATMRCTLRSLAEQKNVYVETVVDLDEFRQLAREDGWSLEKLFAKFKENGASSVCISEDTLSSLDSEGKITVYSTKDLRKLSLQETYGFPAEKLSPGSLFVHSEDDRLLDRINQNLSWKLPDGALTRAHKNLLLVSKSGKGIMEKVGLGFSENYFRLADEVDLGIVVRLLNYPGLSAESAQKMVNAIPSPASVSALIFPEDEMLGARGDLMHIVRQFKNRSYRIGWFEFDAQDGVRDYLDELAKNNRPFVRVHSISRKEMDKVHTPERAIDRWVRAVKDRGLKMLYFKCFFQDENKYIANLTDFNLKYLKDTVKRLNDAGYKIAKNDEERFREPRHIVGRLIPAETLAIGVSLVLGLAALLKLSFIPTMGGAGVLSFAFLGIILFFVGKSSFVTITGIIGAVSYSCIGYVLASDSIENSNGGFGSCALRYLFLLVLPSVIGGVLIAGIHSNIEYMLKFEQFYGVKLAFILPIIYAVAWSLKKFGKNVFLILQKPLNLIGALLMLVVCVCLALYIVRSGNTTILKPTAIEDSVRTFLENTLIARPRSKEFLIGYPAAMLFVVMLMRRELILLPLLGMFIQIGQVSVVNTFCHFHTPITMSLLRIANGLWLGGLIGLAIVLAWRLFQLLMAYGSGKEKRIFLVGYFGFDNAGDEFLRDIYTSKFSEKFSDYSISVLVGKRKPIENRNNINWILRRDTTAIIETLIKSEALVVPGGGVFQSVTSCRSLFYYYFILWLARKLGNKIILLAQGLGPWKKKGLISGWLHKKLANELRKSDYLTVRDRSSVERYKEITSPEAYVEVTSDLAFLNNNFEKKHTTNSIEAMRVCAVLRTSANGSAKIAEVLVKIAKENDNIELVPIAFQPIEDSKVWKKAGWKEEVKVVDSFENAFDGADLVFSMRLHGCIVATNMGIPWVGITYDPKVQSFAESCDWLQFCCEPKNANAGFFEDCINRFAYNYVQCSEKLTACAAKMHKRALEDFENSSKEITRASIFAFALMFMASSSLFAQNNFPAWMDEVEFNKKALNSLSIRGPIDPETGKSSLLEPKINRNFKPKLPNFAELRKKATKTETEGAIVSESLNDCKTANSISDLPELATAAALIGAANRLATEACKAISQEEKEPSEGELMRARNYRPGRIKSFYVETKEAEKRKREEEGK